MRYCLLVCSVLLAPLPLSAEPAPTLPMTVSSALSKAQIPTTSVAIVVQPVAASWSKAPRETVAINTGLAMNPASVMKLLTTYTALNLKGPHWRWSTRAFADPPPAGGTTGAPLEGNVYLKGSGDPKFVQEQLTALLRQLRTRGIERIRGNIVIDREAFRLPPFHPGQFDDFPMRPYNVGPDAFLLNFHALTLTLSPLADNTVQIFLETPAYGLTVDNQVKPGKNTRCEDWKDQITARLDYRQPGQWQLVLQGSYNLACGTHTLNLAPLNAEAYARVLVPALWQELGGTLEGSVLSGKINDQAVLLAEQESPPLTEIIRDINKFSNNVMARQLFLSLADNTPATLEDARARTTAWLDRNSLHFPELVLDNGSGLSRHERISAHSLAKLLQHAWSSPVMAEFMSSLPITGTDGTLRKRLNDTPSRGRGHLKTGTLAGVKSMAGYVLSQRGERFVVVMLINHPNAQQGQAAMDALLRWVIER